MENPKDLEELILQEATLSDDAMEAFNSGDFPRCIVLLSKVVDREKNNWQARLYLAMAYCSSGDVYTAGIHFRYLEKHCPLEDIKVKSRATLSAMNLKPRSRKTLKALNLTD